MQPTNVVIHTVTSAVPALFSEAELIGRLADCGLEVPSAVQALESLHATQQVSDARPVLALTERGSALAAYLMATFGDLTAPGYAAELNAEIAHIASGERGRLEVLHAFWQRFGAALRPPTPPPSARTVGPHKPVVLRPVEEV